MEQHPETVRLDNLTTGYPRKGSVKTVSRDISASLRAGQFTCLLGPNGAGKSTLLKTLCGFLHPLGGSVILDGRPLDDYSPAQLARKVGVVLTERLMLSNMQVQEIVALGRSPYTGFWGRLSSADKEIVRQAMESVKIAHLCTRMNQTLSDGERQKMMIAKALAQQTPVIFLDEPTAFLDYPSKVELMMLLRNLTREKNLTVFLSTHDIELALQVADTVWLLDKELGFRQGVPEDLAIAGEIERYFGRDGLNYNPLSGQFILTHPHTGKCTLAGNGTPERLLAKALDRNGFEVTFTEADAEADIRIANGRYVCDGREHISIESLLEHMHNPQ